jgi:hypothetical protein
MASKKHGSIIIPKLAEIRRIVAFLGSKQNFNWWDCSFLDTTGLEFMSLLFPRSSKSAALEATLQAAQRVHDSAIIKIGTYHLFRLPTSLQHTLHQTTNLEHLSMSRKEALDSLAALADPSIEAPEGAIQVGVEKKIISNDSIRELASHYHSAFSRGIHCFPYFASQSR